MSVSVAPVAAAPFGVAVGADAVAMLCSLSLLALYAVGAQWFNVATTSKSTSYGLAIVCR